MLTISSNKIISVQHYLYFLLFIVFIYSSSSHNFFSLCAFLHGDLAIWLRLFAGLREHDAAVELRVVPARRPGVAPGWFLARAGPARDARGERASGGRRGGPGDRASHDALTGQVLVPARAQGPHAAQHTVLLSTS